MPIENSRPISQVLGLPRLIYGVLKNNKKVAIPPEFDEHGNLAVAVYDSDGDSLDHLAATNLLIEVRDNKDLDASDGAYAANDVLSENNQAGTVWDFDVARGVGGTGYITGAIINSESESVTPRLTLFLFRVSPTNCNLNDNVANTAPDQADIANYVGCIDFQAMRSLGTTDSNSVNTSNTPASNIPLPFKCADDDTRLYGVLVTRDAFTQTPGENMLIILSVEQN